MLLQLEKELSLTNGVKPTWLPSFLPTRRIFVTQVGWNEVRVEIQKESSTNPILTFGLS